MAEVTIKTDGPDTKAIVSGGEMVISENDAKSLITNAKAQGLSIRVYRQNGGYKLSHNIEQAAIDASGLGNFKAEKQFAAQGYIEF